MNNKKLIELEKDPISYIESSIYEISNPYTYESKTFKFGKACGIIDCMYDMGIINESEWKHFNDLIEKAA